MGDLHLCWRNQTTTIALVSVCRAVSVNKGSTLASLGRVCSNNTGFVSPVARISRGYALQAKERSPLQGDTKKATVRIPRRKIWLWLLALALALALPLALAMALALG